MSLFSRFLGRIFYRIYAGIILLSLLTGLFCLVLFQSIMDERAANYRNSIAIGPAYVLALSASRHTTTSQRVRWLENTSEAFGYPVEIFSLDRFDFMADEFETLAALKAVVRYDPMRKSLRLYQLIPGERAVITTQLDQIQETQLRAVGKLLLEDLRGSQNKIALLNSLDSHFSYPIRIRYVDEVNLDNEQLDRIARKKTVLLFNDGGSLNPSSFQMILPLSSPNQVLQVGPIPIFDQAPLDLIMGVAALGMLILAIGLYALIKPLERKVRSIQSAVTRIRGGNLDAKAIVGGYDEISHLASTFNYMTTHIKRLITSQRELTRAISHELRTPVSRVRFAVDMLADTEDRESRFEQTKVIDSDIQELDTLIDEIITHARLEESMPTLNLERVNIVSLAKQTVAETLKLTDSIDIRLVNHSSEIWSCTDTKYLHRVLQNFLGNAIRHAQSKVQVFIGSDTTHFWVDVEDDGEGVDPADRKRIFEPFSRIDESRNRALGNYGLGLSIVARIAFWFDGEAKVSTSERLGGAKFTIKWPRKMMPKKQAQADSIPAAD